MKQDKNAKIAIIGYRLAKGGLERVFSTVSHLLHDEGYDVTVIVLEDEIEYSYSGKLLNLGGFSKFTKYVRLRNELRKNKFKYIIDFRHRINPVMEFIFLHFIYSGLKTIYTVHSTKLDVYLTANTWIARKILSKAYKLVTVSNGLKEQLNIDFQFKNAVVIPNSIPKMIPTPENLDNHLPTKYCIAIGRLVPLKQFDQLIVTYSKSILPEKDIHLVILGDGEEKSFLESEIMRLNRTKFVHLMGFQKDVLSYLKPAEFLILSSKYEGFSMVILEALSASVPVISFDCKSGPRELIQDEKNGLLVENQNFELLQFALNKMVEDQQLYLNCKSNAARSVSGFSAEIIAKKWVDLLN